MAKLVITQEAQNDLDEIIENIVDYTGYEMSGVRLFSDLYEKFELIAYMPSIGRDRAQDIKETFCRNYRIVYKIYPDEIHIIAIIHCKRLYPRKHDF